MNGQMDSMTAADRFPAEIRLTAFKLASEVVTMPCGIDTMIEGANKIAAFIMDGALPPRCGGNVAKTEKTI